MRLARIFILLWFLLAFTLSLTGWFERFSSATLFGFGAIAAASALTVLHWLSERFRGFLQACSLNLLTLGQVFRLYGVMAHMVGLFAPDDMKKWPTIDPADPSYQKDIADLRGKGP